MAIEHVDFLPHRYKPKELKQKRAFGVITLSVEIIELDDKSGYPQSQGE